MDVDATAPLTILAVLFAVGLLFASVEASRPAMRQLMPTVFSPPLPLGRVLFAAVPDVKPVSASPSSRVLRWGPQSGFAVGALSALVSNFFFGARRMDSLADVCVGYRGLRRRLRLQGRGAPRARGRVRMGPLLGPRVRCAILNGFYVIGFVRPLTWQTAFVAFSPRCRST